MTNRRPGNLLAGTPFITWLFPYGFRLETCRHRSIYICNAGAAPTLSFINERGGMTFELA